MQPKDANNVGGADSEEPPCENTDIREQLRTIVLGSPEVHNTVLGTFLLGVGVVESVALGLALLRVGRRRAGEAAGRFMLLASGVALALCVALAFDFAVDFALPLPLLFGVGADLRKSRQEMVSQATSGSVFVFRS